jgi:hypothetical protein
MENLLTKGNYGDPILPNTLNYYDYYGNAYAWDKNWNPNYDPWRPGKFWFWVDGRIIGPGVNVAGAHITINENVRGGFLYPVYGTPDKVDGNSGWGWVDCSGGPRPAFPNLGPAFNLILQKGSRATGDITIPIDTTSFGCRDTHSYLAQDPNAWKADSGFDQADLFLAFLQSLGLDVPSHY